MNKEYIKMRKKIAFIALSVMLLSINLFSAPRFVFKLASDLPDGSSWINSLKDINTKLMEKTNGQVGLVIYPSGVMGDQSTVIKKIKIGQLSGSTFSSGGLGLIYKDFAVMGFPMIFKSYDEYDYVKSKTYPFFEKEFEKRGYVLLSLSEVGLIYLFSSKKVYSVETLRSAKPLLLQGDDISQALFDEIKANPVPIQISDVMTGLQTGLLDTVFSSSYTLIVTQWFTKVKYMADYPITFMIGGLLVEKNLFYSMPPEYQNQFKTLFRTTFNDLNSKVRSDNVVAMESLKKAGIVVLHVPDQDRDTFIDVCNKTALKLTEKDYSRDLLNRIKGYVDDYRKSKK
jgi:TRAP-type transport system periplasmic protein